ncbi:MAG: DUF72 domain-containing protein [Candidatus Altiarchaeota archaeon]|nr:DUF72 domain-containing protein [Candidatus Altiarchaeota archaeon]
MAIGCCGWSYLPKKFVSPGESRLIAYARLYSLVEVTSTFAQLPKTSTGRAWRKEVDEVNPNFEFAVKLPKLITHVSHFTDMETWEKIKSIGEALNAKIMVARAPRNFTDKKENVRKVSNFAESIGKKFKLALEVPDWKRETIEKLFPELGLIHIVNPFEEEPIKQKLNYYHLNGRGETMYRYRFKVEDLELLKKKINKKDYALFNNIFLYEDSMRFMELSK